MADIKYSLSVKHKLWNAISEIASDLNSYVKHSGKDFARKRRLDFRRLIRFLISMEASSQKQELFSFFHYNLHFSAYRGTNQIIPMHLESGRIKLTSSTSRILSCLINSAIFFHYNNF